MLADDLTHLRNRAVTIVSTALDNERCAAGAVRLAAKTFEIVRHRCLIRERLIGQLSFGAAKENTQV